MHNHSSSSFSSSHLPGIAATALTGALLLSGCGNGEDSEAELEEAQEEPTPLDAVDDEQEAEGEDGQDSPEAEPVDFPGTLSGETAEYIVQVLNAEEASTAEDWENRLSETFRSEYDEAELAEVINTGLRPAAPFTPTDHTDTGDASVTHLESEDAEVELHIQLDEDELIELLVFLPPQEAAEDATSFEEIQQRLPELPGDGAMLVLQDGEEVLGINTDQAAGIGSTFKLYVLLALVEAIEEGETSWDETLELAEEHMSLPSGNLQNEDPGYEVTVQEAAQAMIEISDNTATDLLIDHLGRQAVEAAVEDAEHHNPQLLQPFLTTRELFQLRWGAPELGEQFSEAIDVEDRREILEEVAELPLELEASDITDDEGAARGLEWFATVEDIAQLLELLEEHAEEHSQLRTILSENPGIQAESPWWDYLAFKGGSSPGVLAGAWFATDEEGTERTVVFIASGDPQGITTATVEYFGLATNALELEADTE